MKKYALLIACVLSFGWLSAQESLPAVTIRNLAGQEIDFKSIGLQSDTAVIVSLWATWCVPCIRELETMNEQLEERQKDTPFKLVAISVDDNRTAPKVRSFVKGHGWDFDIYLDTNNDLKRALNINDVPHVLIIKNGKIVFQHNGYVPGNEEMVFEKLKELKQN